MRVLSAMSGGVDSAVATARLMAAGHQVTGVHLALSRTALAQRAGSRGCCSLADVHDARRVADRLGIDFYVWDFSERFADQVIGDFLLEYSAGRTPNPCLRCNERIKFAALLDKGLALGYDAVATGHYARLVEGPDGLELRRARDDAKDQSYVLGVRPPPARAQPVPARRQPEATGAGRGRRSGIRGGRQARLNDICFIPDGDTAGFLADKLGEAPGRIVDAAGNDLGAHRGTYRYTIGQRKGLNLGVPSVDGRPRYVVGFDPERRQVVVGGAGELAVDQLRGVRPTWTAGPRRGPWRGQVQVRAHGEAMPAEIEQVGEELLVRLDQPCRGVAPGQYAVCYDGEQVVGSAVIAATASRLTQAS